MLSGIAGNTTAEDRLAGAREVFKKYPGIEILDHQYCDWSPPKAKSIMEAMIQAFPRIDGIWADRASCPGRRCRRCRRPSGPLVPSTGDQLNGYTKFLVANKVRGYAYPMTTKLPARPSSRPSRRSRARRWRRRSSSSSPATARTRSQTQQARAVRLVVDRRRPMPAEFLPKL